jgi:hypothetical protein
MGSSPFYAGNLQVRICAGGDGLTVVPTATNQGEANYGSINYNPTYSQAGIVGRFFRLGVHFKF